MAIQFVTGLPRAGKTLWCLSYVKELAVKEGRQVYTCNIPEVTITGWLTIDHPDKWMDVPNGSIIIVDELQDFWGLNATGSKVALPVLELSKHGKRGIDFWFITQEPELVHRTPRALCQHHYFVVRAFGSNSAAVYKFERMQQHPDKVKSKGEKFPWRYPSEAFGRVDKATGVVIVAPWYKSADTHNVKRRIPAKVYAIPVVLAIAALSIWGAYSFFSSSIGKAKGNVPGAPATASASGLAPGAPPLSPQKLAAMSRDQYVSAYTPRLEGLQHTAPVYDALTAPRQVPMPAACISSKSKGCHCYTQQGTPYATTDEVCTSVVKGGMFIPWIEASNGPQAGGPSVEPAPHSPPPAAASQVYIPPVATTQPPAQVAPAAPLPQPARGRYGRVFEGGIDVDGAFAAAFRQRALLDALDVLASR